MADNSEVDPGSGGDIFRTLEDTNGIKWPAGVTAYALTVGTPDSLQIVTTDAGLPVQPMTGASWAVTGTFWQATQPVSIAGTVTVTGGLTDAQLRATPVPVSGTVAATQSGTWTVQPGNTANTTAWLVTGTGGTFPATQSGTWNITNVSGTISLPTGASTLAEQQIQTASLSVIDDWDESDRAKVNPIVGQAGVQGNTGVVTATTQRVVLATDVALPSGSNVIGGVTQSGTWTVTVSGTSTVTTGAEKAEDSAHSTGATGNFVLAVRNDAGATTFCADGDYSPIAVDSKGRIGISDLGDTITVDGTVTANAGTNLNTSALALEAGGNLAAAAASLSVLDDWDETNRAAVNTIAGQVGVQGASGVVTALTQRVVLATDVGLPTGSNVIGAVTQSGTWNVGTVTTVTTVSAVTAVGTITPGTAATSLGKAEDAAHASGDVGVMGLAVRRDTASALATTDGDYIPLTTNATGYLWVDASGQTLTVGTHAVTQSGTWNIGTVTTVTTVSAVTAVGTITPGTAATSLGKAEDAAHASGDVGVFALAVRSDTAAATGTTDGDYCAIIVDSTGRLHCNVSNTLTVASHAVTNAGTFVVQENGAALTALQVIDNPVIVDDAAFTPAATSVMMAGFEFDDTAPDSVNEGDGGAARMSANRNIYTTIRDAAGNERGVNVNASSQLTVSVDNTVTVASHAVTNAGTFEVQPGALATVVGLDTIFSNAATATAAAIKASAGRLYALEVSNPNTSDVFLQLFDLATGSVTLGTTVPKQSFLVPAAISSTIRGAFDRVWTIPVTFATAITYAVTTTPTGNTAPGSNSTVNAEFK